MLTVATSGNYWFLVRVLPAPSLSLFISDTRAGSTYPSELCGTVGFVVGALFSIAHRAATVRIWKTPTAPLNVVVTGTFELSYPASTSSHYVLFPRRTSADCTVV
jgi:hypothetical protein